MLDPTKETTNTETQTTPAAGAAPSVAAVVVTEPPAAVIEVPPAAVVPDGYVKSADVETERTARTAAEQARAAAETRATAAEARARSTEIRMAAAALNFNDPADAERFIAGDAEDLSAALAEVLKTKPYLAKVEAPAVVVTPTSPTNPARTAALSLDAIKGMTKEQIAANWGAVKEALRAGQ